MQRCLVAAAERGVAVSLIVPLHNNHRVTVWAKKALETLAAHGVDIYAYSQHGGMTHAKALLADEWAAFGSSNFNQFLAGRIGELTVVSRNRALVSQLEVLFNTDMAHSVELFS